MWTGGIYGFRDEAVLYDNTFQQYGQIFIMNADGSGKRMLTDSLWEDSMPLYIPAKTSRSRWQAASTPSADTDLLRASHRAARRWLACVLALAAVAYGQPLAGPALVAALRHGGYVILMRHASSPRNAPPTDRANPDNLEHERQLDETGRTTAQALGQSLRRLRIPIGQVLSSPTYRALETIRLAQLPSPKTYPELGEGAHGMGADESGQRGAWIRAKVAEPPARGTDSIIVTHFPNIAEAFPADSKGLDEGEALVFRPDGQGHPAWVARVKIDDWPRLAASP